MFALAISAASGFWGGYGFIYIPRRTGALHPALARILHAYDPDYLVDALWTYGDLEATSPGWRARHGKDRPDDSEDAAAALKRHLETVVPADHGADIGIEMCSPYNGPGQFRPLQVLSDQGDYMIPSLAAVLGGQPRSDFPVPHGLDPQLTLALGLRAGFPEKPPLPVGREVETVTDRLPSKYVQYVLSTQTSSATAGFSGLTPAWTLTRAGLVPVAKPWPLARPTAVLGSSAEDFALAVALDRMFGTVLWVPTEWAHDHGLRWLLQRGYYDLLNTARVTGSPPIVTSISLPCQDLDEAVRASWPLPVQTSEETGYPAVLAGDPPEIVPAERLDLQSPRHLACVGDYALPFTSPSRADGRGGVDFLLPVPAYTPRSEALRGPQRPFWEVDVELEQPRMPAGRDLRAPAFLAGDATSAAVLRSGRDGICFHAMSMLLVHGGMTLEQSITKIRLHIPGLYGWIDALTAQNQPEMNVQLSQAGRRGMILTRLWGNRAAVARDLLDLHEFLQAFKPHGSGDAEAYPDRDGVRLTPAEGYLTLQAAIRTLRTLEPPHVRERVNHLLHVGVLHRGLIIPCSECERRAFYRIELVGEINTCPRCGARAYSTAAWRSEQNEPQWFYDLHGAVRELLNQNGDVPFLAGLALAAGARSFEDIAELDFCQPGREPGEVDREEIDIAALADGRLIIGEAKSVPKLGSKKEVGQAITKLLRISNLLGADEILLATSARGPWEESDIDHLLNKAAGYRWRFGSIPRIRVLTNLRNDPQSELLDGP